MELTSGRISHPAWVKHMYLQVKPFHWERWPQLHKNTRKASDSSSMDQQHSHYQCHHAGKTVWGLTFCVQQVSHPRKHEQSLRQYFSFSKGKQKNLACYNPPPWGEEMEHCCGCDLFDTVLGSSCPVIYSAGNITAQQSNARRDMPHSKLSRLVALSPPPLYYGGCIWHCNFLRNQLPSTVHRA